MYVAGEEGGSKVADFLSPGHFRQDPSRTTAAAAAAAVLLMRAGVRSVCRAERVHVCMRGIYICARGSVAEKGELREDRVDQSRGSSPLP